VELQNEYPQFQALNAEILAVSIEDASSGQHLTELLDLQFPVIPDVEREAISLYGVYNLLGDSLATPSVFVIDTEGVIRWEYVGQSSADRPSNDVILNQLRALGTP
jgi:peroxiredoxin